MRVDSNDYSVHPSVIGRRVEITADLEHVVVTAAGAQVAAHERCWADHQSITDPAHHAAAVELRHTRLTPVPAADTDVEQRDLTDYDRLLGLDTVGSEGVA